MSLSFSVDDEIFATNLHHSTSFGQHLRILQMFLKVGVGLKVSRGVACVRAKQKAQRKINVNSKIQRTSTYRLKLAHLVHSRNLVDEILGETFQRNERY